jgi:hypothetical protein
MRILTPPGVPCRLIGGIETARVINTLQADLQAVAPRLLQITRYVGNLWFLNFLTCRKDIRKLARVRRASLLKLPGIGSSQTTLKLKLNN